MVSIPCSCTIKWPLTVLKIIFKNSTQSEKPGDVNVASKSGLPRNSDVPPYFMFIAVHIRKCILNVVPFIDSGTILDDIQTPCKTSYCRSDCSLNAHFVLFWFTKCIDYCPLVLNNFWIIFPMKLNKGNNLIFLVKSSKVRQIWGHYLHVDYKPICSCVPDVIYRV